MKKSNPIQGKTVRFHYSDGAMARKSFEHHFDEAGFMTFRQLGSDVSGESTHIDKYELARVGEDVYAVSYLSSSGYTLTTVVDVASGELVSFASNEKGLSVQHGTFEGEPRAAHSAQRAH